MKKIPRKISIGDEFTRLTIVDEGTVKGTFICDCSCGTKGIVVKRDDLISKHKRSCNCLQKEVRIEANTTHGLSADPETRPTWSVWNGMIQRCMNPNDTEYFRYGAKGIKPCRGLQKYPEMLIEVIGLRPNKDMTIDRWPDNTGGYWCGQCKECREQGWKQNIRWATRSENNRNQTNRILYEAFGRKQLLIEWCEEFNLPKDLIISRIFKRKWSMEKSLTEPVQTGMHEAFGRKQTVKEWAAEYKMSKSTLQQRIKDGMNMEEALTKRVSSRGLRKRTLEKCS